MIFGSKKVYEGIPEIGTLRAEKGSGGRQQEIEDDEPLEEEVALDVRDGVREGGCPVGRPVQEPPESEQERDERDQRHRKEVHGVEDRAEGKDGERRGRPGGRGESTAPFFSRFTG